MALKQQRRTAEMTKNDTKMDWNCNSDREKRKYNSTIPTMAPSSKRETTGFEIQSRDKHNPQRGSLTDPNNFMISWFKTKKNFIVAITR